VDGVGRGVEEREWNDGGAEGGGEEVVDGVMIEDAEDGRPVL